MSIDRLLKSMLNTDDFRYSAIKGDASKRKFYKVTSKKNKYILMDSSQEIRSYRNYLKFHNGSLLFFQTSLLSAVVNFSL